MFHSEVDVAKASKNYDSSQSGYSPDGRDATVLNQARDTTKLQLKGRRKLIRKQHPELIPVVSYVADVVRDIKDSTSVASGVLLDDKSAAEVCVCQNTH